MITEKGLEVMTIIYPEPGCYFKTRIVIDKANDLKSRTSLLNPGIRILAYPAFY